MSITGRSDLVTLSGREGELLVLHVEEQVHVLLLEVPNDRLLILPNH